jgi:hypothetical protein
MSSAEWSISALARSIHVVIVVESDGALRLVLMTVAPNCIPLMIMTMTTVLANPNPVIHFVKQRLKGVRGGRTRHPPLSRFKPVQETTPSITGPSFGVLLEYKFFYPLGFNKALYFNYVEICVDLESNIYSSCYFVVVVE